MKTFRGQVLSVKMAKTAVVGVAQTKIHPLYKKRIRRIKRYHVHDGLGVKVGDQVEFRPTRPISKTKKWTITKRVGQTGEKAEKVVKGRKSRKGEKK